MKVEGFSTCWCWPARRSHLRLIWALDITNSSQFDGQSFCIVVWQFPAGWILVYSHRYHLKTTRALRHVKQAQENSPKESRPVNHWQWHTHGWLVHWCSNWLMVKSVPCHLVWTRLVFTNLVTYINSGVVWSRTGSIIYISISYHREIPYSICKYHFVVHHLIVFNLYYLHDKDRSQLGDIMNLFKSISLWFEITTILWKLWYLIEVMGVKKILYNR